MLARPPVTFAKRGGVLRFPSEAAAAHDRPTLTARLGWVLSGGRGGWRARLGSGNHRGSGDHNLQELRQSSDSRQALAATRDQGVHTNRGEVIVGEYCEQAARGDAGGQNVVADAADPQTEAHRLDKGTGVVGGDAAADFNRGLRAGWIVEAPVLLRAPGLDDAKATMSPEFERAPRHAAFENVGRGGGEDRHNSPQVAENMGTVGRPPHVHSQRR